MHQNPKLNNSLLLCLNLLLGLNQLRLSQQARAIAHPLKHKTRRARRARHKATNGRLSGVRMCYLGNAECNAMLFKSLIEQINAQLLLLNHAINQTNNQTNKTNKTNKQTTQTNKQTNKTNKTNANITLHTTDITNYFFFASLELIIVLFCLFVLFVLFVCLFG